MIDPVYKLHAIIINGYPRSGKDTFVDYCKEFRPEQVVNYSSISPVIVLAKRMGFDVSEKNDATRTFLSELGRATEKFNNFVTNGCLWVIKDAYHLKCKILFIHIREPEQIAKVIQFVKNDTNINTIAKVSTLLVKRQNSLRSVQNYSDQNVEKWSYDYIIHNDHTLDVLKSSAANFLAALDG